jgi:hypothetical protein
MTYFELTPAYGHDYKSAKEVKEAFLAGNDFVGDYQLGFKLVNIADIAMYSEVPKSCTVNLRYSRQTKVATLKVPV